MSTYSLNVMSLFTQLNDTYLGLDNVTAVLQKTQFVMSQLESGFPLSDRLFNPDVWTKVLEQFKMDAMGPVDPMDPNATDG